jgi:hypothetical protein
MVTNAFLNNQFLDYGYLVYRYYRYVNIEVKTVFVKFSKIVSFY